MDPTSRNPLLSRRVLGRAALVGTVGMVTGCSGRDESGHCFSGSADNARLDGLRVFQQAFPPMHDGIDSEYRYWPCTDAATAQDFGRSTWTGGNIWAFLWANRCNAEGAWNSKPNPLAPPVVNVAGQECRATFTSHARANAATRCQMRYLLGMGPDAYREPWLRLPGTGPDDFVTDRDFRARPEAHCRTEVTWQGRSYRVMQDKVLVPAARLTDGENSDTRVGVVLDYEVQDGRRPEITEAFVHQLAHDTRVAGKKLTFLTNPFNAPTQRHTGCTPDNLPRILSVVDHLAVFLWSRDPLGSIPRSYAAQLAMLGPLTARDHEKLILNFELGDPGTTMDDAWWLHRTLHGPGNHPDKVMFWRHHAELGGDCDGRTNQKISVVCFGR